MFLPQASQDVPIPRRLFWLATLSLILFVPTYTPSATGGALRVVPQLALTALDPIFVAFHPHDEKTIVLLNRDGRIELFDISSWARPVKRLELLAAARSFAVSPDGNFVVSGGHDGRLWIWDGTKGGLVRFPLEAHKTAVSCIAYSPDGTHLITGSDDGTIKLWNHAITGPANGIPLVSDRPDGSTPGVTAVAFAADGERVAATFDDGTMSFWDVPNPGTPVSRVNAHDGRVTSIAFSRDGKYVVTGGLDNAIRLWNARTYTAVGGPLEGHSRRVRAVALSPDNARIFSVSDDYTMRVWDVQLRTQVGDAIPVDGFEHIAVSKEGGRLVAVGTGKVSLFNVQYATAFAPKFDIRQGIVHAVAFSPEGEHIAFGTSRGAIGLWSVGRRARIGETLQSKNDEIRCLAFSQKGDFVASGGDDGIVELWDVRAARLSRRSSFQGHQGEVESLAISRDGTLIASAGADGAVRLWDVKNETPITLTTDEGQGGPGPPLVAFSPVEPLIASAHRRGIVRFWDTATGVSVGTPIDTKSHSISGMAFYPDGTHLIVAVDGGILQFWDLTKHVQTAPPTSTHGSPVYGLDFSADGTMFASKGFTRVQLWYAKSRSPMGPPLEIGDVTLGGHYSGVAVSPTGTHVAIGGESNIGLWRLKNREAIGSPLVGNEEIISQLAFARKGKRIIATRASAGMLSSEKTHVWDVGEKVTTKGPVEGGGLGLAISPDGAQAVVGGYRKLWHWEVHRDKPTEIDDSSIDTVYDVAVSLRGDRVVAGSHQGNVRVYDVRNGIEERLSIPAHHEPVIAVGVSGDGRSFVSAGHDGIVRIWDARTGVRRGADFERHQGWVFDVEFTPEDDRVLSAGADGVIQLWDAGTGRRIGSPWKGHIGKVRSVAVDLQGVRAVSTGDDGLVRLWDVATGTQLKSAPSCVGGDVSWIGYDVVVVHCWDRLVYFSGRLQQRGHLFLSDVGLVGVIDGRGVYADPPALKDLTSAFEGPADLGVPRQLPFTALDEALYDEFSYWARFEETIGATAAWIVEFHRQWGPVAWVVWSAVLWFTSATVAVVVWVVVPGRLAWWLMRSERPVRMKSWGTGRLLSGVILPFLLLGTSRRALAGWLRQNRQVLEAVCFARRDAVLERERYFLSEDDDVAVTFQEVITREERCLLWIYGGGGSGKSSLAMYLLRREAEGRRGAPLPVFVGEDWDGSLAAQVARQMRAPQWRKGPTEHMVKVLGAAGLVVPLVDSLSERANDDVLEMVAAAVSNNDFRHLVMTSRKKRPDGQVWQGVRQIVPRPLLRRDVTRFVATYLPEASRREVETVKQRIAPMVDTGQMPSPLFLRFAVAQAEKGQLKTMDRLSLILEYLEALRENRIDLHGSDMRRAAAIAAIESVQDELRPKEVQEQRVLWALNAERNSMEFRNAAGTEDLAPAKVLEMLIQSGLLTRGTDRLQFAYDPVAEYLVAWWVGECAAGSLETLRRRMERADGTELGRAYQEIVTSRLRPKSGELSEGI